MKIIIIGSGAVGKSYGELFDRNGNEVHFLLHSDFLEVQKKRCFKFFLHSKEAINKVKLEKPNAKKYNVATPLLEFIEKAMTQSLIETLTGTELQTMLDSNSISMPTCRTDNTLSLGLG